MSGDTFGEVSWCRDDIIGVLLDMGIDPADEMVDEVFTECKNNHHFTDAMIEAGFESIGRVIDDVIERRENGA